MSVVCVSIRFDMVFHRAKICLPVSTHILILFQFHVHQDFNGLFDIADDAVDRERIKPMLFKFKSVCVVLIDLHIR